MRLWIGSLVTLVIAVASPFAGSQRDAATVLKEMRQALGGDAALDQVKTFSANGTRSLATPMGTRRLTLEWAVMMPDHFLEIRRDSPQGPIAIDIVYYTGVAGTRVIRRTDARGLTFPPDPRFADNSPAAVAARERAAVVRAKQELARLTLVLFGAATSDHPLQFSHAGVEQAEGRTYDLVDATGPDGFQCRLHVDTATHLPAMLTWQAERPHVVTTTTSSIVGTRNGQVVSQSPENASVPVIPDGHLGLAPKRWLISSFKAQDGINWPRKIEEVFDGRSDEIRIGGYKINPKIDARKFDIK